jgi:hypothetical protein
MRAGKLHGAIAHSVQSDGSADQREAAAEIVLFCHFGLSCIPDQFVIVLTYA